MQSCRWGLLHISPSHNIGCQTILIPLTRPGLPSAADTLCCWLQAGFDVAAGHSSLWCISVHGESISVCLVIALKGMDVCAHTEHCLLGLLILQLLTTKSIRPNPTCWVCQLLTFNF